MTKRASGEPPEEPQFIEASSEEDSHVEASVDPSEASEPFEPYVEWVGAVGYREITSDQWEEAGVTEQGTVVWTRDNPRVNMSELTESALQRLNGEPNFKFVSEPPKEED